MWALARALSAAGGASASAGRRHRSRRRAGDGLSVGGGASAGVPSPSRRGSARCWFFARSRLRADRELPSRRRFWGRRQASDPWARSVTFCPLILVVTGRGNLVCTRSSPESGSKRRRPASAGDSGGPRPCRASRRPETREPQARRARGRGGPGRAIASTPCLCLLGQVFGR